MEVFGRVQVAAEDQAFGQRRAHSAGQERVGPHAREKIEQDFGESHEGAAFGDDHIARKGGLESPSLGVAL